jgi:hypothetical protein
MSGMAPYEGLLATIIGVEHRDGRPARRRVVAVATDQRVLLAMVRDPAHPQRLPYAQVLRAEVHRDEHGTHVELVTRNDGSMRVDRLRDSSSADIFAAMVNTRAGTPARQPAPSSRIRLVTTE